VEFRLGQHRRESYIRRRWIDAGSHRLRVPDRDVALAAAVFGCKARPRRRMVHPAAAAFVLAAGHAAHAAAVVESQSCEGLREKKDDQRAGEKPG